MISGSGNDDAPPGELLLIALGIGPDGKSRPELAAAVVVVVVEPVTGVTGELLVTVGTGAFGLFLWAIAS